MSLHDALHSDYSLLFEGLWNFKAQSYLQVLLSFAVLWLDFVKSATVPSHFLLVWLREGCNSFASEHRILSMLKVCHQIHPAAFNKDLMAQTGRCNFLFVPFLNCRLGRCALVWGIGC